MSLINDPIVGLLRFLLSLSRTMPRRPPNLPEINAELRLNPTAFEAFVKAIESQPSVPQGCSWDGINFIQPWGTIRVERLQEEAKP